MPDLTPYVPSFHAILVLLISPFVAGLSSALFGAGGILFYHVCWRMVDLYFDGSAMALDATDERRMYATKAIIVFSAAIPLVIGACIRRTRHYRLRHVVTIVPAAIAAAVAGIAVSTRLTIQDNTMIIVLTLALAAAARVLGTHVLSYRGDDMVVRVATIKAVCAEQGYHTEFETVATQARSSLIPSELPPTTSPTVKAAIARVSSSGPPSPTARNSSSSAVVVGGSVAVDSLAGVLPPPAPGAGSLQSSPATSPLGDSPLAPITSAIAAATAAAASAAGYQPPSLMSGPGSTAASSRGGAMGGGIGTVAWTEAESFAAAATAAVAAGHNATPSPAPGGASAAISIGMGMGLGGLGGGALEGDLPQPSLTPALSGTRPRSASVGSVSSSTPSSLRPTAVAALLGAGAGAGVGTGAGVGGSGRESAAPFDPLPASSDASSAAPAATRAGPGAGAGLGIGLGSMRLNFSSLPNGGGVSPSPTPTPAGPGSAVGHSALGSGHKAAVEGRRRRPTFVLSRSSSFATSPGAGGLVRSKSHTSAALSRALTSGVSTAPASAAATLSAAAAALVGAPAGPVQRPDTAAAAPAAAAAGAGAVGAGAFTSSGSGHRAGARDGLSSRGGPSKYLGGSKGRGVEPYFALGDTGARAGEEVSRPMGAAGASGGEGLGAPLLQGSSSGYLTPFAGTGHPADDDDDGGDGNGNDGATGGSRLIFATMHMNDASTPSKSQGSYRPVSGPGYTSRLPSSGSHARQWPSQTHLQGQGQGQGTGDDEDEDEDEMEPFRFDYDPFEAEAQAREGMSTCARVCRNVRAAPWAGVGGVLTGLLAGALGGSVGVIDAPVALFLAALQLPSLQVRETVAVVVMVIAPMIVAGRIVTDNMRWDEWAWYMMGIPCVWLGSLTGILLSPILTPGKATVIGVTVMLGGAVALSAPWEKSETRLPSPAYIAVIGASFLWAVGVALWRCCRSRRIRKEVEEDCREMLKELG